MWAPKDTTGYNTKFTEIQTNISGSSSSGYTFAGDLDGSDNWAEICAVDPEGTQVPATNYPAFNFANTYGTTAELTGTDYENGWYVPSIAELYEVYKNKKVIQTSLNAAGGFTIGTSIYWSSSQSVSHDVGAYYLDDDYVLAFSKSGKYDVLVLKALTAE